MNILPLLTYYVIHSHSQAQFKNRDITHEIAHSLIHVIEEFFTPRSPQFVFVLSCERPSTMYFFDDLLFEIFHHWGAIKTQIIINKDFEGPAANSERMYNLVLVDSWKSFLKIDPAAKVKNSDVNEFYHVILQNRDRFLAEEVQKILEYFWKYYIINANVQVQTELGEIIVYTYFPFTKSHCGKVVPVEINRFQNFTMLNDVIFPQKVNNMFGCPIRVATWSTPPYLILDPTKNGKEALDGFEGQLLVLVSDLMNFDIKILEPPNNEKRGLISGNKTTGAARMLQDGKADIGVGNFWFSQLRSRIMTPSYFYYQVSNGGLFFTAPSYYSPIQSIWFPFHTKAAAALLIAFFITLGILLGLVRIKEKFLLSVHHRNVCLNYIAYTLGLSTLMTPRRISGRTFIMTWMLFTFVIRTKYAAIIYHFMRNNLFRTTPSTMDEIVKLNYVAVLSSTSYNALAETSLFTDTGLKHILVNDSFKGGQSKYMEDNQTAKLITISPLDGMLYSLAKNRKLGEMSFLKQNFLIQNICIFFTKHSFLVDRVNTLVLRITSVGLMDAWVRRLMDSTYLKAKRPPNELRIDQHELMGVYYLCGFVLLVSVLVFCLEILSKKFNTLQRIFEKL